MGHVHFSEFFPDKIDWVVTNKKQGFNGSPLNPSYEHFNISEKEDPKTKRKWIFRQGGGRGEHPNIKGQGA